MTAIKTAIVIGAGSWGGWTAYHLQKMGVQVKLIDARGPGNPLSGSGGQTRVIRMAYGGNVTYTDFTARSFELWRHYEADWQEKFYHQTGSLWLFRGSDPAYARLSQPLLEKRGLSLEKLSKEAARARFPQVNLNDVTSIFFEPECGYLEANRSCQVVKAQFEKLGGEFIQAKVGSIVGEQDVEALILENGAEIRADAYVFACGPWTSQLLPFLKPLIRVSRQEVYFFEAAPGHGPEVLPIWIEFRHGQHMYYGIPGDEQTGFKMAYDERTWLLDPEKDDRGVTPEIFQEMKPIMVNRFPAMENAKLLKHHTCVYECSPDGDFIIDQIPGSRNGWLMCGSSGHGFKMGPALGEAMAQKVAAGLPFGLPEFSLKRFENSIEQKTQYQVS